MQRKEENLVLPLPFPFLISSPPFLLCVRREVGHFLMGERVFDFYDQETWGRVGKYDKG